ncbi:MAG: DsbE family thiol:disulfide interchange protein [Hyphomicrobiaceae bacterium]
MTEETAQPSRPSSRRRLWLALPLVVFAGMALVFKLALTTGDPSKLPSALIGKPVPVFVLPAVDGLLRDGVEVPGFRSEDLSKGQVSVLNVFASWCGPCHEEHPVLMQLAARTGFQLVGLSYKDDPADARRFLGKLGNPYVMVGQDAKGRVALDFGVYGVPETFVVDAKGRIAYKHVGPLTDETVRTGLLPAIAAAAKN